jgi:predicted TIM-barrel fold metal-dependent hydrolase
LSLEPGTTCEQTVKKVKQLHLRPEVCYTPFMPSTRRQFIQRSATVLALAGTGCATAPKSADGLIIDTHLHLWDLGHQKLPWLDGAPEILRKSYRLEDYRAATAGLNVRAVYMEVDVAEETLPNEAELILGIAAGGRSPILAAVIGGRPADPGFAEYLGRFQSNPRCKGVRQVLHTAATPAGYCLKPEFIRGVQMLGEAEKSFDLCMRAPELMDGAKLAAECPRTRFILDHCGNPDLKSFRPQRDGEAAPAHTADTWKRSIDALAKQPNVICKISGVAAGLPPEGGAEDLAPAVNHCLDAFGPDRVVFGGDWPVCLLGATYQKWVQMLRQVIVSRSHAHQMQLWSGNALRLYGLHA